MTSPTARRTIGTRPGARGDGISPAVGVGGTDDATLGTNAPSRVPQLDGAFVCARRSFAVDFDLVTTGCTSTTARALVQRRPRAEVLARFYRAQVRLNGNGATSFSAQISCYDSQANGNAGAINVPYGSNAFFHLKGIDLVQ